MRSPPVAVTMGLTNLILKPNSWVVLLLTNSSHIMFRLNENNGRKIVRLLTSSSLAYLEVQER